jgi:rod shape-determining protein MreD
MGWLAVVVIVQCSLLPEAILFNALPDLFLLSVIIAAMRLDGAALLLWACTAGLFQDVLSGGIVGMHALTKPLTGMGVMLFRWKLDFRNPNTQSTVAVVASLLDGILMAVLLNAYLPHRSAFDTITRFVIPAAVLNGICLPLILVAGKGWRQWWRRMVLKTLQAAD